MNKFYLFSKSIHRYLVIITCVLTVIMGGTGAVLKYPQIGTILGLQAGLLRYVHNQVSTIFSVVLFLMMISGMGMYGIPLIKKKPQKTQAQPGQTPDKT